MGRWAGGDLTELPLVYDFGGEGFDDSIPGIRLMDYVLACSTYIGAFSLFTLHV